MKQAFFSLILLSLIVAGTAQAMEKTTSSSCVTKFPPTASCQKEQANAWMNQVGIDTTGDGFAKDMMHLVTGIDRRLNDSASLTVSASNRVKIGLTF